MEKNLLNTELLETAEYTKIAPTKEDIVVYGRIVSGSTEGVVADSMQIYDSVSNINQHEVNKKFLTGNYILEASNIKDGSITADKLADNSIQTSKIDDNSITSDKLSNNSVLVSKISLDVWDKMKTEYLQLEGGNMEGIVGWRGSNEVTIGENGIYVGGEYYKVDIDANGNSGCIFVSDINDEAETLIYGLSIRLLYKDGLNISELALNSDGIDLYSYIDDNAESVFRVNSDSDEGDKLVHGIGFATFDLDNIGLLSNDGTVGLALTNSDIDGIISEIYSIDGDGSDMND